jgi:hypothetical protein|tara:strand:+ start:493 stop:672 length:180 start_codon:yes stop_codon:yes gene_type:complete
VTYWLVMVVIGWTEMVELEKIGPFNSLSTCLSVEKLIMDGMASVHNKSQCVEIKERKHG